MTQKLLELFRSGMDTQAIAKKIGKSEAWVYAAIHRERCLEKGDTAHEEYRHKGRQAPAKIKKRKRNHKREYLQKMANKGLAPLKSVPFRKHRRWVKNEAAA